MKVYTLKNTVLTLKEPPLSSGGEGAVYEILGYPNRVAKIYHDTSDAKKREEKIKAMVNISCESKFKVANIAQDIAWPLAPLFDQNRNMVGFGMNRISANTELDDLYVYPSKNQTLNIKEKIEILISLCDVIDRLHITGQVFGDFNPNNIKIKSNGTVNFVDADSYHVKKDGKEYRCVVCAPGYVAPELMKACKGTNYADCTGTTFTKNTDNFALAIHIFRMLMNGCHPFICERHLKRAGSLPAPKSTDKRVESGETPFFTTVRNYTVPHYAPDINALPPYIRDLFKRAFVDGHTKPDARPSASEWKNSLIRFSRELIKCNHGNTAHFYWKGYYTCPYCEADNRYSQKLGKLVLRNNSQSTQIVATSNNINGTYAAPKVASSIAGTSASTSGNSGWFWVITMACMAIMQILLAKYVLPYVYWELFGNETLMSIGVVGSVIAGCIGGVLYNTKWCNGKSIGSYKWYEYILSLLTSIGFTVGFGVAMTLALLVLYILAYIFVGALIISVIIGVLSGG